jgi:hypothetical protein
MTTHSAIRASDSDRESVVAILRDAYTVGRLTLEEFDERTTAALSGRTWGELRELTQDLPQDPRLGADLPGATAVRSDPAATPVPRPAEPILRIVPLLPFAALWLMIALTARMPDSVVPVLIALLLLLRCTVRHPPARQHPPAHQRRDRPGSAAASAIATPTAPGGSGEHRSKISVSCRKIDP